MKKTFVSLTLAFFLFIVAVPGMAADARPLTFGTLPVIQALPIFLAEEMGLYQAEGVAVKIIPFRNAMEKDVAMTTGQIDGYFGDIFTSVLLKAGGTDIRMTALTTTSKGGRTFGILAAPGSGLEKPADLAGVPVAVSTNTIIEYITANVLASAGLAPDQMAYMEVKNIPVRFQMLLAGQVKAATLPEPLATLAESKGCKVIADDGGTDLSATVLVFSKKFLDTRREDVTRFQAAQNKAVERINAGGPEIRATMNLACNIPEPLQASFPLPQFPQVAVPDEAGVMAAVDWLSRKGVIKSKPGLADLVDGGSVPR